MEWEFVLVEGLPLQEPQLSRECEPVPAYIGRAVGEQSQSPGQGQLVLSRLKTRPKYRLQNSYAEFDNFSGLPGTTRLLDPQPRGGFFASQL